MRTIEEVANIHSEYDVITAMTKEIQERNGIISSIIVNPKTLFNFAMSTRDFKLARRLKALSHRYSIRSLSRSALQ